MTVGAEVMGQASPLLSAPTPLGASRRRTRAQPRGRKKARPGRDG